MVLPLVQLILHAVISERISAKTVRVSLASTTSVYHQFLITNLAAAVAVAVAVAVALAAAAAAAALAGVVVVVVVVEMAVW